MVSKKLRKTQLLGESRVFSANEERAGGFCTLLQKLGASFFSCSLGADRLLFDWNAQQNYQMRLCFNVKWYPSEPSNNESLQLALFSRNRGMNLWQQDNQETFAERWLKNVAKFGLEYLTQAMKSNFILIYQKIKILLFQVHYIEIRWLHYCCFSELGVPCNIKTDGWTDKRTSLAPKLLASTRHLLMC